MTTLVEPITARGSMVAPDTGIYAGIPFNEYHQWRAASNSRLNHLKRSPAHLRAYLDQPAEDTQALLIGRAAHSAVLEPDLFAIQYTVAAECDAIKKGDGKKCANAGLKFHPQLGWLCGVHMKGVPGTFDDSRIALSPADYGVCTSARDAIHKHSRASKLLSGVGDNELSCVWTDEATSVVCKSRLDRHSPLIAGGAIIDIKTTRDASPREFERSIFSHGYHRQGAMYLDGAKAVGIPAEHFVIVAVEKEPPFAVAVYRVLDAAIEAGREQIAGLLKTYATCVALNEWPGYAEDVVDVALPPWAWGQIDEENAFRAQVGA